MWQLVNNKKKSVIKHVWDLLFLFGSKAVAMDFVLLVLMALWQQGGEFIDIIYIYIFFPLLSKINSNIFEIQSNCESNYQYLER